MAYKKTLEMIPQELLDRCDKAVAGICNDAAMEIMCVIMSTDVPSCDTTGRWIKK